MVSSKELASLKKCERSNRRKEMLHQPVLIVVVLAIAVVLFLFSVYPLLQVFIKTVWDGKLDFSVITGALASASFWYSFKNTIVLGLISGLIATVIGFVFAFAVVRTDMPLKKFFHLMAQLPIISPPFIMALAVILLCGRSGLITKQLLHIADANVYGIHSLIFVQVLAFFPLAYLNLKGILESLNPSVEDAGQSLGASRWQVFYSVTLPLCVPAVFSSFLIVFIKSVSDFANPQLLGGDFSTLSSEAYLQINGMYNTRAGSFIALSILFPSIIAFFIERYWISKKSFVSVTGKPQNSLGRPRIKKLDYTMLVVCSLLALVILVFYGTVFWISFVKTWGTDMSLSLNNFRSVFSIGASCIKGSLILALIATPITAILGMVISYLVVRKRFMGKRILELATMLTFAVPGIVLGIGYILSFNKRPLLFTGTAFIIIMTMVFRNMSVGIEAGTNSLRQIDASIEEASTNLGANTATTFMKITLPLIKSALYTTLVNAFVRSMTSISAVIFVVSVYWNLLTVMIMSEVENSQFGVAAAYCVVLTVIVLMAFGILQIMMSRLGKSKKKV